MNNKEAILLTPGPLTTSAKVKHPMIKDYGSRDKNFINIIKDIRQELLKIANAESDYSTVLVQGSGTYAVESCITSLVSKTDHLLILVNGAYGKRIQTICEYSNIPHTVLVKEESEIIPVSEVETILNKKPEITHVAAIYCETTTGLINPIEEISRVVNKHGKSLLIDAMSAFGAFHADARILNYDAVMASSNKCLHGVPGMGFVIAKKSVLEKAKNICPSLSLDLHAQWVGLEKTGQFRFTPPVQVLASFIEAIREFNEAGGVQARYNKFKDNFDTVVSSLKSMGFKLFLDEKFQGPIIITFLAPTDQNYDFEIFYKKLSELGFIIYPGKLTAADTFRIGCIGHVDKSDMQRFVEAVKQVKQEMGF